MSVIAKVIAIYNAARIFFKSKFARKKYEYCKEELKKKEEEAKMKAKLKNSMISNMLKMVVIAFTCVSLSGCSTTAGQKAFVWLYETFNDLEEMSDYNDPVSTNTPPVVTNNIPQDVVQDDTAKWNEIKWLKENYKGYAPTKKMLSASCNNSRFSYDYEKLDWHIKTSEKATADAIICVFAIRDGKLVGGKFDWKRVGQKVKGMENIRGGYIKGFDIVKGEECYLALVSIEGKQRTNLQRVVWK